MSQLYKAPSTPDIAKLTKWYLALSEPDRLEVIRDIVTVTNELQGILLNAIIPNMKLTKGEADIRDIIATRFLKAINEIGIQELSKSAQTLFDAPEIPDMIESDKVPEEKPSK